MGPRVLGDMRSFEFALITSSGELDNHERGCIASVLLDVMCDVVKHDGVFQSILYCASFLVNVRNLQHTRYVITKILEVAIVCVHVRLCHSG
jgi:hypothetical protein